MINPFFSIFKVLTAMLNFDLDMNFVLSYI